MGFLAFPHQKYQSSDAIPYLLLVFLKIAEFRIPLIPDKNYRFSIIKQSRQMNIRSLNRLKT